MKTDEDQYDINIQRNINKVLKKSKEKYLFTGDEVMELLCKYYNDSGGESDWRMFRLTDDGNIFSDNWQLKYIRIYRTDDGLVICDKDNRILQRYVLFSAVNKDSHSYSQS